MKTPRTLCIECKENITAVDNTIACENCVNKSIHLQRYIRTGDER